MLLIVEIILTIFAWRKGWKWMSLIPIGLAILIGGLIGVIIGASGGNTELIRVFGFIIDIIIVIVLIIMTMNEPKSIKTQTVKNNNKD